MLRKFNIAATILYRHGIRELLKELRFAWLKRVDPDAATAMKRIPLHLAVGMEDVLAADWTRPPQPLAVPVAAPPYAVHWVVPPFGPSSGGQRTIFRFARHLSSRGHGCRVFIYDPYHHQDPKELRQVLAKYYPTVDVEVRLGLDGVEDADALFATSWDTAYPVFNAATRAKKFYFVQDFEPYFYPAGSQSVLAANTYRFGLHGITAGKWLSEKLSSEFGMPCDPFEFGADATYRYQPNAKRDSVLFYARPVTPRRGFELGVLALQLFARQHPEYRIEMFGWDVAHYNFPFPSFSHGTLTEPELNQLYNRSAAALVLSLTNLSLLPHELLAAGCIPVVNDAPNNRLVCDNDHVVYTQPTPRAMAEALHEVVSRPNLAEYASAAAASVQGASWEDAGRQMERAFLRVMET